MPLGRLELPFLAPEANALSTELQGCADYAFFQHILKSLDAKTGRCAILFPHGVLFRKEEADMRQKLVEADLVECVLGLGLNLFYNSPMEACIVICRTSKPPERRGKALFINAVDEVTRERSVSFLKPEHQKRIANAYHVFTDIPGFARLATLDEIRSNDGNLSIPLYVRGRGVREEQGAYAADVLKAAVLAWEQSSKRLHVALGELLQKLS